MEILRLLSSFIVDALGPSGPLIIIGILGVFLFIVALPLVLARPADPFDKLQGSTAFIDPKKNRKQQSKLRKKKTTSNFDKFAAYLEPQDQKEYSNRQLKLVQAGYRDKDAVRIFHALQLILALIGIAIGAIYTLILSSDDTITWTLIKLLLPGFVGYYLPHYIIERNRATRSSKMLEAFPDALDLMLICVESGQTLDQTIIRVSRDLQKSHPILAEELIIISNEIRAGKERSQVLRDFGQRSDVNDIKAFVTVLIQSVAFGTTISESLRLFSSEMRDKRVLRAEEKANKLPTKMTLCTMLFTLPPLLLILIGPSLYDIYLYMGDLTQ